MNPVSEQIDERILRLLGLEDVFDLDYDTYLTLLKEAIVTGSKKLPQEELAILANERKRVRGKKGRFSPKKEKITADKVATTKLLRPSKKTLALPAKISKQDSQLQQGTLSIGKPLESIANTLAMILKFRKKKSEEERRDKESQKRTKREEGLEGFKRGISAVSGAAKKLLAPFQSIIDRIWRFIFFTLLGRAFTQLMDWLGDPANKRKIEVISRFLKDWWPALLGAAVLFFTPFGKFVRNTLKIVGFFTGKLVKLIPGIARAVKGLALNPWFAVPAAAVGLAAVANEVTGQRQAAPVQAANKARAQTGKGLGVQGVGGVGDMGPTTPYGLLQGAARGGTVMGGYDGIDTNTGEKVSGFGPDTQMIVAQPGEIVMNKKTVDAVGAETFLGLNRQYGGPGANKPKMGTLYNSGGMVGGNFAMPRMPLPRLQEGGVIKLQGGGIAENSKRSSSRAAWDALNTGRTPLKVSMQDAQERLLNRQAQGNTNINTNVRPWWDRLNPFADRRKYLDRLPLRTPIEKYRMPGFDLKGWGELKGFREDRLPVKPNSKNPKIKYAPYQYEKPGVNKPLMLQGGGEVESLERTYKQGQRSGASAEVLEAIGSEAFLLKHFGPGGVWRNFKGSGATDYRGNMIPQRMGGGLIKENTGMNIRGATADRQLAALQPGEYVLPVDTVNRLGTSLIDKLVAMTDSNSTPFKKSVNKPQITPLSRGNMQGMMTLPPIVQSASAAAGGGSAAGSKVSSFSVVPQSGVETRITNANLYGIGSLG
jgi:hypothetical protein